MHIKQYKLFKAQYSEYSLLDIKREYPISYVAMLFYDGFPYINKLGVIKYIETLKTVSNDGMIFEMIEISMNNEKDLAYLSEPYNRTMNKKTTPEIEELLKKESTVELCHKNFMGHAVMTQENLFHLFSMWEQFIDKQSPYVLIYLNDKDWYDSLSFDSQEAIEKFLADNNIELKSSSVKIENDLSSPGLKSPGFFSLINKLKLIFTKLL